MQLNSKFFIDLTREILEARADATEEGSLADQLCIAAAVVCDAIGESLAKQEEEGEKDVVRD